MRHVLFLPLLALAACASVPATPIVAQPGGSCRNEALASFVGQPATQALGSQMLAASGARVLRWVAKGMVVTMEFRADRLTVYLDAANRVDGLIQFNTQDLSVGGAFIRSDLLFEVGEELTLEFALPDGRTVRARGKVVRVARDTGGDLVPGMGIQFVNLADADRDAIRASVRGSHG